ncbi:hypothetical protein LCGC14_3139040 [marine sediment metagenome]|uniref:Uncharacterized protein n=1 Tax=marine sediment metagenome TaxID=412755 RepID=A0A0F8Y4E7_9ZZZZ
METLGEDVRRSDWYIKYTNELVERFVEFKKNYKDGDFLRGEIVFNGRQGRLIKPFQVFTNKADLKEIPTELED